MYESRNSDDNGFPEGLRRAREIEDRCHVINDTHPELAKLYRSKCLEYRMSEIPPEEKELNTDSQKQDT